MEKTMTRNEGGEGAAAPAKRREGSQWRSKAEEYQMISNLTGFDNLRAMMEGEATVKRRKRRRNRNRNRKKNNNEFQFHAQQPFPVDAAVKENKKIETVQAVKGRTEGNGDEACSKEVVNLCSSSFEDDGMISNVSSRKRTGEMVSAEPTINEDGKMVRRKELKAVVAEESVGAGKNEMHAEKPKCIETVKLSENSAENTVLQKLLRKPRYFDPPNGSWASYLSCGKDHQAAANWTLQNRVKACFLCGSLQHFGKHCGQGQYCFVCRGRGHQAYDCPEKQEEKNSIICLRCGDAGHDMFSCRNDYSPDDLKKIRCYICNDFGHLSCVKLPDTGPTEVSCYNCGQSGHLGSECSKCPKVAGGSKSHALCYRCRDEGHFARTCTLSRKHARRIQAKMRSLGSSSAPPDCGPQNDVKDAKGEI
ncbi:uncharacterized protein LOC111295721 isoform X2 [Durio zibethinus]|uniref:Uncharacterized protein LOC111295721 isoform X2 n=1 Tax=Durio zibethinus TaxID=66656 RepID=A0A6P5YXX4_DURZI|nr:uncharacterized protein LOC111295721 isoform X2 [Durio zibethinus]